MSDAWSVSPPMSNSGDVSYERFLLHVSLRKLQTWQHRSNLLNTVLIQGVYDKALEAVLRVRTISSYSYGQRNGLRKSIRKIPKPNNKFSCNNDNSNNLSVWDMVEEEDRQKRLRQETTLTARKRIKSNCDDSNECPSEEDLGIITPSPSPKKGEEEDIQDIEVHQTDCIGETTACNDSNDNERVYEEDPLASSPIMGIAYLLEQGAKTQEAIR
eukprot:Ihof_evm4s390 gene=Ihof_evmTU4s390